MVELVAIAPLGVMMVRAIQLDDLAVHAPALTPEIAAFYKQSCMVCLDLHGHLSGVLLNVDFTESQGHVTVSWTGKVDEHVRQCHRDREKRVDHGACAVALMILPAFTSLVAVLPSAKGDGIDYYLSDPKNDDDLIFNHTARLEVSGIQSENGSNTMEQRIATKRRRLTKIEKGSKAKTEELPTYICVVEFGQPKSKVVLA